MPVQATPLGNLVGYWKFDETTTGTAPADSSGNANTLALVNTPAPSTDVPTAMNQAFPDTHSLSFNGSTQFAWTSAHAMLDSGGPVSVSAWVKFNSISGNQTIVAKWQVGMHQQWVLQLNGGHISWWTGDGGTGADNLASSTPISAGIWYHLVATDTASGLKTLYINGKSNASDTAGSIGSNAVAMTMGSKADSSGTDFEYLNGELDDVRVYSRVLSAAEAGELASGTETSATWTGATSTDYGTGSNWNINAVPDPYTDVIIPKTANRTVLGQDATAASVTVNNGGILDLNGNNVSLNDASKIENFGTVISQNSETSTNIDTTNGTVMYANTASKTGLAFGNSYNNLILNDGLMGYWKLDGNTTDSSGYGNDGAAGGSPTYGTDIPSVHFADSKSASFDGTNYVQGPDYAALKLTNTVTMSAWVKPASLSGSATQAILSATQDGGTELEITGSGGDGSCSSDSVCFFVSTSGAGGYIIAQEKVSDLGLTSGQWAHIAGVYDGSAVSLYVNGVLANTAATSGTINAPDTGTDFCIGMEAVVSGCQSAGFTGNIDDARIYNRALSGTQIANLGTGNEPGTSLATTTLAANLNINTATNLTNSMVGHWPLDEANGATSAIDSSGNGNTGTFSGTTPTSPPSDLQFTDTSARNFNGTTDKITIPAPSTSLNTSGALSISAWIKPTGWGGGSRGRIFDRNQNGEGYLFAVDNNNVTAGLNFSINAAVTGKGTDWVTSNANVVKLGQWQQVTVTWSGEAGGTVSFYVNGKPAGTATLSQAITPGDIAAVIGGRNADTARGFNGSLDDVRVYRGILSAAEIAALAAGNTGTAGSLVLNGGTLDVSSSNYTVTNSGDFINNGGVFNPRNGSVILHGGDQAINSSNTFYNLTKDISSGYVLPHTLTFGQGSTTTVTHTLTLKGGSSVPLSLMSSTQGTQWKLNPTGSHTLSNLTVEDGDNLSGSILYPANSTDSGNNTGWFNTTVLTGGGAVSNELGSASTITDLQVTSQDPNPTVNLKLFVSHGTISMSTIAGLTFYDSKGSSLGANQPSNASSLQFSGTLDDVNAAMATLHYTRTDSGTGTDSLSAALIPQGSAYYPANGHLYQYVGGSNTWSAANTAANASSQYGAQGYLATVTSQGENDFIANQLKSDSWIGGSDQAVDGTWIWTGGPEANQQFWQGLGNGSTVGGMYAHWNNPTTGGTGAEPNGSTSENCLEFYSSNNGLWNDLSCSNGLGYVIEYGGLDGVNPTISTKNISITTVDTTAPSAPGKPSVTPASPTADTTPSLSWTASTDSDGLANPAYTIQWSNDAGFSTVTGSATANATTYTFASPLADGTWYFRVIAKDATDNTATSSVSNALIIDTTAPDAPGQPTTTSPTNSTSPLWTWTASTDTGSGIISFGYTFEWSPVADFSTITGAVSTSATAANTPVGEGTWYTRVQAQDKAGNISAWSATGVVVIDTTAPDTPAASLAADTYTSPQTVSLTADDNASGSGIGAIYYTLDGSTPDNSSTLYTGPITVSKSLTLKAIAYDQAGNAGGVLSVSYTIVLPTPPPSTNTNAPAANTTTTPPKQTSSTPATQPADTAGTSDTDGSADDSDSAAIPTVNFENNANKQADPQDQTHNTSAFLGLGWWWLLVAAAVAFFWRFVAASRKQKNQKQTS